MTQKSKSGGNLGRIVMGAIVLVIVLVGVTFPLWQPYFLNVEVDEDFPVAIDTLPQDQQETLIEMRDEDPEMADEVAMAIVKDDTEVNDDMPEETADEAEAEPIEPTGPITLSSGSFGEYDPVHAGSGTATIFELNDGSRILRFEDFRVTNGPDLHVILTANEPTTIRTRPDEGYIDLGELKGNVGNQNYEIPADVDLSQFNYVVIYCQPFHVNFSFAELSDA